MHSQQSFPQTRRFPRSAEEFDISSTQRTVPLHNYHTECEPIISFLLRCHRPAYHAAQLLPAGPSPATTANTRPFGLPIEAKVLLKTVAGRIVDLENGNEVPQTRAHGAALIQVDTASGVTRLFHVLPGP